MAFCRFKEIVSKNHPKILGVGFNYFGHIDKILEKQPPKYPTIFDKAWSTIQFNPKQIHLPICKTEPNVQYELQLGVFINKRGKNIKLQEVMSHIGGYFIAIDITDRTRLRSLRQKGLPFTLSKSIDHFSPISELMKNVNDPYKLELQLKVNGVLKQITRPAQMFFKIDKLINFTSQHMTLEEGDLIFTGTPSGVGPLKIGDHLQCVAHEQSNIELLASLDFTIQQ